MTGAVDWRPLGTIEVPPGRLAGQEAAEAAAWEYAVKSQTHLWRVVVMHRATEHLLDLYDNPTADRMPILDVETLTGDPGIVCFVCERSYERRLRHRKCLGEPPR